MNLNDIPISENKTNDIVHTRLDSIEKLLYGNAKMAYETVLDILQELNEETQPQQYIRALYLKARATWQMGRVQEGLLESTNLLNTAQQHQHNFYVAEAYNLQGNVYINMDNLDKALECYREGLRHAKTSKNPLAESRLLNNIGEIYNYLGDHEEAQEYYGHALNVATTHNLPSSIALVYLNLGDVAMKTGDYELALNQTRDAMVVYKSIPDKIGEAHVLALTAIINHKMGNLEDSETLFEQSMNLYQVVGDLYSRMITGMDFINLLIDKRSIQKALSIAHSTLELSESQMSNKYIAKSLSMIAKLNEMNGSFEEALKYYKLYHDIDRINEKEKNDERLKHISTQFKAEQSHHEKELFRLRNFDLKSKNKELKKLYENIFVISTIGREITSTLDLQHVFDRIYENLNRIMDATVFGIGFYNADTKSIEYPFFLENGSRIQVPLTDVNNKNSLSAWCLRNKKDILINDYLNEYQAYKENPSSNRYGRLSQSILYTPLYIEESIIGVVTAQTYEKNAYTKYHQNMLNALASYIAIAIKNAQESRHLEQEIQERKKAQKELVAANRQLKELTYIDALTHIPNRRHFVEMLSRELDRSIREQEPLAVILIDIDKFKEYNDNYGHTAGDTCLEVVAQILKNSLLRKTDFVARYGGDEFVAVLPNTELHGAYNVAESIRRGIESAQIKHAYSSVSPIVSITLGIYAEIPPMDSTLEKVVHMADQSLYTAKALGRNCIVGNSSPIHKDVFKNHFMHEPINSSQK